MSNLIIGASSGVGRELAYEFGKNAKNVILVSRDKNDLENLKADLQIKYKIKVDTFELDFSKLSQVTDFFKNNISLIENIDGVLFPIGMMKENDNMDSCKDNLDSLFSANFYSQVIFINNILKIFQDRNKGFIVGFGSISGSMGRQVNTVYASAKSALETFFESLIISNQNEKINVQFYKLGYLDTNLSFGKKLLLPKGSAKKISKIVYSNLNKNGIKKYFPFWWIFIDMIIKILPFFISKNIIRYFK